MEIERNDWDTMASDGESTTCIDARARHNLAERERRKSMRELLLSLHACLPPGNKVRRQQSAILNGIINYIPLAAARLRTLQKQKDLPTTTTANRSSSETSPTVKVSNRESGDCDIRVMPDPSSSISIRVSGDRVNVSLTQTKGTSQTMLFSAVLYELEAHGFELVRAAHFCYEKRLLHLSENKICNGLDKSPALLKESLQALACKLHKLKKSSPLKRSFDQVE